MWLITGGREFQQQFVRRTQLKQRRVVEREFSNRFPQLRWPQRASGTSSDCCASRHASASATSTSLEPQLLVRERRQFLRRRFVALSIVSLIERRRFFRCQLSIERRKFLRRRPRCASRHASASASASSYRRTASSASASYVEPQFVVCRRACLTPGTTRHRTATTRTVTGRCSAAGSFSRIAAGTTRHRTSTARSIAGESIACTTIAGTCLTPGTARHRTATARTVTGESIAFADACNTSVARTGRNTATAAKPLCALRQRPHRRYRRM
jgi:hypothetical protein